MSQVEERSGASGAGSDSTVAEAKEKLQEKTGEAVEQVRGQAGQATDRARTFVDERSTDLGRRVGSTAGAMRRTSEELRAQGKDSEASLNDRVAGMAERVGSYLEEADADRMLHGVEDFGRRRPWMLALAGAGLGFLGARFLKASSERRGQELSRSMPSRSAAGPRAGYEPVAGAAHGPAPSEPYPGGIR